MLATISAGMNSQNNMAINHMNIKSFTYSPIKHIVVNNVEIYCIGIQNRLLFVFIS